MRPNCIERPEPAIIDAAPVQVTFPISKMLLFLSLSFCVLFNTYFIGTLPPPTLLLLLPSSSPPPPVPSPPSSSICSTSYAADRTIASSDLNTWINRGVLAYIRHIIVFRRVEQTTERRFLTLNKQTKKNARYSRGTLCSFSFTYSCRLLTTSLAFIYISFFFFCG